MQLWIQPLLLLKALLLPKVPLLLKALLRPLPLSKSVT